MVAHGRVVSLGASGPQHVRGLVTETLTRAPLAPQHLKIPGTRPRNPLISLAPPSYPPHDAPAFPMTGGRASPPSAWSAWAAPRRWWTASVS
jgi:hypothetical protein